MKTYDVAIIGAGPAGIMAAITAAQKGRSVILIEKNDKIGRKILATGNGRCNVTNRNIAVERYHGGNPQFIKSILDHYGSSEMVDFLESKGVFVKEENMGRIFPRTNQASTVVDMLKHELDMLKVFLVLNEEVVDIKKSDVWDIATNRKKYQSKKIVITTGGKAAHQFGSSGDGLFFAQKMGHKITPIYASLCPIEIREEWIKNLQGIKIEAIIRSVFNKEIILETKGDAIFTHFGISGPAAMAQSRVVAPLLEKGEVRLVIDLYPENDESELDSKLERLFRENSKKSIKNNLSGILTSGIVPIILNNAKIDPNRNSAEISKSNRKEIIKQIKSLEITVEKIRPLKEAQVTSGGILLSEVNPQTLESRIVPGLYFAGEILDVDGDSGGFNLQWAWSSGFVVGQSV